MKEERIIFAVGDGVGAISPKRLNGGRAVVVLAMDGWLEKSSIGSEGGVVDDMDGALEGYEDGALEGEMVSMNDGGSDKLIDGVAAFTPTA